MKSASEKLEKWTKRDVALVILTYIANFIVIVALFTGIVYINRLSDTETFEGYFSRITTPFHFLTLLLITIVIMAIYFIFEERDFLRKPVNSQMLFLIIEIGIVICFLSGTYISVYLRPLPLVMLLVLFLTNRRTAIFVNVIFCIIMFLFDVFSIINFELAQNAPIIMSFLIMGVSSGILAIFLMDGVASRIKLLLKSLIISIPTVCGVAVSYFEFGEVKLLASIISGAFSGPLAVVLFIVLLPAFEMLFKRVTCFRFAELTDHRAKLLRRMITQAPGTFNHSLVVSNIAEACATAIGEDALLARTCAYYHDIGKLRRPEFFKENQIENNVNPHDDLTPELSTSIIRAHANDGYNLALKNRLPEEIANVCREHHGTLPILFFYDKAKKFTDGQVDINQFCYLGPKPQTKIAAIIMISDGCEAAVRSLKDRSRENVQRIVRHIVNERMQTGQFEECEITLKELNIIIHTIVNNLTGIYHSRVAYPKVNLDGMIEDKD